MSKYQLLIPFLDAQDGPVITLSFAQIEAIVGPLPREMRTNPKWWGTTRSSRYLQTHLWKWRQAGYIADLPDFSAETVTFRRRLADKGADNRTKA